MKTPRLLTLGIASMLLTSFTDSAATWTWSGASIIDHLTDRFNWTPNTTAPPSDLTNTDLIFPTSLPGTVTPLVNVPFSARSITFANTAGAFTFTGQPLTIGTGGITNNDTQVMTFFTNLNLASGGTINAASGGINIGTGYALAGSTLSIRGNGIVNASGPISATGFLNVGNGGAGSLILDASGRFGGSASAPNGTSYWGENGGDAHVTFQSGATGDFGALQIGRGTTANTHGVTRVVTTGGFASHMVSGQLRIAADATSGLTGSGTVTGAGSAWMQSGQGGASTMTIGAASLSSGELLVENGAHSRAVPASPR